MIVNLTNMEVDKDLYNLNVRNPIPMSVKAVQELNMVSMYDDIKVLKRNAGMLAVIASAFAKTTKIYAALIELSSPIAPYLIEALKEESLKPLFLTTLTNGDHLLLEVHNANFK